MERITGPFGLYSIAAYTIRSEEGAFHGYAKICLDEPADVWLADAVDKVTSGPYPDERSALEAAEAVARQAIELRRSPWSSTEWLSEWR